MASLGRALVITQVYGSHGAESLAQCSLYQQPPPSHHSISRHEPAQILPLPSNDPSWLSIPCLTCCMYDFAAYNPRYNRPKMPSRSAAKSDGGLVEKRRNRVQSSRGKRRQCRKAKKLVRYMSFEYFFILSPADDHMINVACMTRGRRDGILKKGR